MAKLKITLKKSCCRKPEKVRRVIESLGLRKVGGSKICEDNPVIRGMIDKTSYMLEVESVD
ncbi:MAG: 50S ribosomal protein L30 [Candidatus Wallbacteria bacterium]|nr:50S ribosomal protein L30 [Candidatus Wallbacteria bacterium]